MQSAADVQIRVFAALGQSNSSLGIRAGKLNSFPALKLKLDDQAEAHIQEQALKCRRVEVQCTMLVKLVVGTPICWNIQEDQSMHLIAATDIKRQCLVLIVCALPR